MGLFKRLVTKPYISKRSDFWGSQNKNLPYTKPTNRATIASAFTAAVELSTKASIKHFLQKTVLNKNTAKLFRSKVL